MGTQMQTMADMNRHNVERFLVESHSGNPAIVDELVTPDVVCHGFPGGDFEGRDAYKDFFRGLNAAFPGMETAIDGIVADEGMVAVRWTVGGVHSAPFAGVPATGRKVRFSGMVLYRMREGRIAETWLHPDTVSLLGQMGVLAA